MIVASGEQPITTEEQPKPVSRGELLSEAKVSREEVSEEQPKGVQLNIERLKLIDEISRLILVLKKQYPELAEHLSKARDNFSAKMSEPGFTGFKDFQDLRKPDLEKVVPEKVKNFVGEVVKILLPKEEAPVEYKLIVALSKNDFASVDTAVRNIIDAPPRNAPPMVPTTATTATVPVEQPFRVIFNALQELKELGIPRELEKTPLKELETIVLQKTGIEIPKKLAENLSAVFSEKPEFATVSIKIENTNQVQITPLPNPILPNPKMEFEIPLPKDFPIQNIIPQKTEMAFSLYCLNQNSQNLQNLQNLQNEVPILNSKVQTFILQPWPASAEIPKEERIFWQKTELPLTPQTLNIRNTILSFDEKLPEKPEVVRMFANSMHEMSLQTEQGKEIPKEQVKLLWKILSEPGFSGFKDFQDVQTFVSEKASIPVPILNSQIISSLLKYQPAGNHEGELFKSLPEPVKKELLKELPVGKTWLPEILQKAVEKVFEVHKAHEEIRNVLQNFKEQIQWTRIDQDTRVQNDKENVFYFMHEGELQKGRLKIKDERGKGNKKRQDSSISFSIETKTKNLGNVHADLTLNKNILNIRMQDEKGTALDAVNQERETLAKELADIGISLGELVYGKTLKVQILPIAKKEISNGGLDVRA